MKKYLPLTLILLILSTTGAFSEEKMRIAVIDLKAKKVPNVVAVGVTNIIRSDLVDTGLFNVVERNQMKEIMKEQELQMTGCTDQACAVEVGKLLSARKILIGEITKLGKSYLITTRIVDVERGVAEYSSREKANSDEMLDKAASSLARKLVGRITGKTESQIIAGLEKRSMSGYYMRSIVPGWGQLYADRNVEGYTFLGLFAAAVGFSAYAIYDYNGKKSDYEGLSRGSEDFDSKFDSYDKAANVVNYSLIALGVVYLAHWGDAVFFARPAYGGGDKTAVRPGPFMDICMNSSSDERHERRMTFRVGYRF
jgi:TolB-like protein